MNHLKADYYATGPNGYVKYKNVEVDLIQPRQELEVFSKCNQILPYQIHPIQIKSELLPVKQIVQSNNEKQIILSQTTKKPQNIMQRQQVLSVHIDQKRNNRKFQKNSQKQVDSVRDSTITTKIVPKSILKHSMNQFESATKRDMNSQKIYKKQFSERSILLSQVQKQKLLRQNLQIKYQRLVQTLIKNKLVSFKQNESKWQLEDGRLSQDVVKTKYKTKYNLFDENSKDNNNSWGQNCSQKDKKTFKNNECVNCKSHLKNCYLNNEAKNKQNGLSVFILGRLQTELKQLNQRIAKTQKTLYQQKISFQEDKMMNLLFEKDKQIEELQKYNQNLKQKKQTQTQIVNMINAHQQRTNLQVRFGQKIYKVEVGKKQSFLSGVILAILLLLVFSSFKSVMC